MTIGVSDNPPLSRIEALRQKHAALSSRIEKEQNRPVAADFYLRQLKKQKLLLKDEIQRVGKAANA